MAIEQHHHQLSIDLPLLQDPQHALEGKVQWVEDGPLFVQRDDGQMDQLTTAL